VAWPANRAAPGRDPRGGVTRSAARKGTSGTGLITVSWVLCDRPPAQAVRERAGGGPAGHMAVFCNAAPGCRPVWYRPRHERR